MINNLSESFPLSINIKGKLLSLKKPVVMGILNINNDSFYVKSRMQDAEEATELTSKMLQSGAQIIDVGAASSRSGAKLMGFSEEIDLLLPVLERLILQFPETPFSVDTYNSKTAEVAIKAGAAIINDISAGNIDKNMLAVVAQYKVPYIMMHMQGIPEFMQDAPKYEHVVQETIQFFVEKVGLAKQAGVKDIIIDPGFGFGKTLAHNYSLLKYLHLFKAFQLPLLCGLSRKSIVYKVINTSAEKALNGTTVLNTIALLNGASILRVHDVLEAKEAVELVHYYSSIKGE
jgi:dihydropteroate synthase